MNWLHAIFNRFFKRKEYVSRSLLHALKDLVPPNVLRDVVFHSRDTRHLGTLAAAWIGITEQELMKAVALKLGLPFQQELIIDEEIQRVISSHPDLLEQLEARGAILSASDLVSVVVACVDPTELRGISALPLTNYPIVLSTWTAIRASLDRALATVAEADAERAEVEIQREEALALEAIHLIFTEIIPYDIRSADLFLGDERPRYQFVLQNGKRGIGLLHAKVAPILDRFLRRVNRVERPFSVSGAIGSLRIAIISEGAVYRLIWSPVTRQLEENPLPALPAPSPPISTPPTAPVLSLAIPLQDKVQESPPEKTGIVEAKSDDTSRPRILLADDNTMFARILEKYFDKHGFSTVLVKNGREALEWLQASELPSLVVTDLHMPLLNGRELIAAIRADEKLAGLKIIVLTSDEDAEAEIQMLGIGADAFVAKSKDPRVLCSHATRLATSGRRREAA